jgi:hypothetical protein
MPRSNYLFTSKRLGFRLIEDTDFDALKELDMDPEVRVLLNRSKNASQKTNCLFRKMVLVTSP